MGKTIQVASDREYDETKTVLAREYAQGLYIKNPLSAEALKLMHFLISSAGSRVADDIVHQLKLSEMHDIKGLRRHTRTTLEPLFQELAACVLTVDNQEIKKVTIGGFLDEAEIDYSEDYLGELGFRWNFRKTFRRMVAESNHWAMLDRQTLFALSSKYSILLFQHFSSLQGLKYQTSKVFSIDDLRALLGISVGKVKRYAELNRDVLKPAISEINQLSHFTLTATPKKLGRTVVAVEISWEPKKDARALKNDLSGPKLAPKVRGKGTTETSQIFPATGSIEFSKPWNEIARKHGNGKDKDLIANDFRKWCEIGNISLDASGMEKRFTTFCKRCKV